MHAAANDAVFDAFSFDDNFAGVNVGGGAIGLISPRAAASASRSATSAALQIRRTR